MLLAVDIGNTNTVFGLSDANADWLTQWRISTPKTAIGDDWAGIVLPLAGRDGIDLANVGAVAIGSVVPNATIGLGDFIHRHLGLSPLFVRSDLDLGIELGMDYPAEVGADRIANAVAAWELGRSAAVVVDLGTATKVEAIDSAGTFRGGAIAPGLGVTLEALTSRAARLFTVDLESPDSAIGRNTVRSMQSGVVRGHAHLVCGLVSDIADELGTEPRLIVTGGHSATLMSSLGEGAVHIPDLTLDGIRLIHNRNQLPR